MNAETLEALLIDRALGQLSPEVEVLLAEHLATHPDAARAAAELTETVALATSLLKPPTAPLQLPPCSVAAFPAPQSRRFLALAASFVAGAGAAFLAVRGTAPQPAQPIARASAPVATPRPAEIDPAIRSLPFWSKERAVALASAKPSTR